MRVCSTFAFGHVPLACGVADCRTGRGGSRRHPRRFILHAFWQASRESTPEGGAAIGRNDTVSSENCMVNVTQFRPRRSGPEAAIEDWVAAQIPVLFQTGQRRWTASSVPLGAGMPDLVIAAYTPLALALADADLSDAQILGYLRAVRSARLETIAERMRVSNRQTGQRLQRLVEARALKVTGAEAFSLAPGYRDLLPEIITIEVKVGNWRRAADQARRNRIFSHRSFVALPSRVAERVKQESAFVRPGLGLLAVDPDGGVLVTREARRTRPVVWTYYYQLAALIARSAASEKHAV